MTSNCHPRSRCRASWDPRAPRAAERAGSFGRLRIHARDIASGWYCSGGQVLAQRWRHIARSTLETETLAQPDRGRSQGAECGDIDCLAVHHARLEHLGLHGGGRETAQQPELDLRAAIEAAHVGDVAVDEVAEPARRAGAAVKAGQEILVIGYARPERRRTSADRGAIGGRTCVHASNYAHHENKSRPKPTGRGCADGSIVPEVLEAGR